MYSNASLENFINNLNRQKLLNLQKSKKVPVIDKKDNRLNELRELNR